MNKRRYTLRKRAEREAETRRRITEAVVRLHETVGPARTRISDIARLAGVQRLTVYTHFPDEGALLQACSAHWQAQHPVPDPAEWSGIADPEARLRVALGRLYAYYRETAAMTANLLRDASLSPAVAAVVESGYRAAMRQMAEGLMPGWGAGEPALLRPAVLLALDFETWQALVVREGMSDEAAIELMVRFVRAASASGPARGEVNGDRRRGGGRG